ncbi:MAG TPA: hypothetical protein VFI47_24300 [Acidimicrobiales bacterium]|nr:hypothetical protein [Acidimicrobiales bacterium]
MDVVEELVARDRIRQLAERYALAVDGRDLDGIADLFRRRRPKPWYRQHIGHPTIGPERIVPAAQGSGSMRGAPMPGAFPHVDAFWADR